MLKKIGTIGALAMLAGLIFLCQAGAGLLREGFADARETSGEAAAEKTI